MPFLKGTDIILLSDEVYEHIIFDDIAHESVLKYPDLYARCLAIYSFGKTFHNTGWKMGYCVGPPALTTELRKIHQFNVFSSNTPIQHALAEYMEDAATYENLSPFYQQKRDLCVDILNQSGFEAIPCGGTYFQLARYGSISDEPDLEFAKRMTREYGVAAIPISVFYSDKKDEKVLRFCFAKTQETLEQAGELLLNVK